MFLSNFDNDRKINLDIKYVFYSLKGTDLQYRSSNHCLKLTSKTFKKN